ncbi:MAG: MATE family efflux transporter [Nitrososphaerota archaeon]|nr:MATE family efflux transporter [Nitrososphaerota archaeon]
MFTHSLIAGMLIALLFVAIGIFFTTPLAKALGADFTILPLASVYIRTILCFAPVFVLNNILIAFIRNDNNPKLAMAGMITASFSNIVLDYLFIFPLSMGMFGAALATGLAFTLSITVLSTHFWTKNNKFSLHKCGIKIKEMTHMFSLGSSALVNELAFAVSLITFNLVILKIAGNIGVAAFGIVANIALIVICIFTGVAQGIQPLISKGHGSGVNTLVNHTLKYAIITVVTIALVIYGLAFFNTAIFVYAFNSNADAALAFLATNGIQLYFVGLIFAGINFVVAAYFSAIGNAKTAVIISLLRSCVISIPLVIILGTVLKMNGIWLSFIFTELITSAISAAFLYKKLNINCFSKI